MWISGMIGFSAAMGQQDGVAQIGKQRRTMFARICLRSRHLWCGRHGRNRCLFPTCSGCVKLNELYGVSLFKTGAAGDHPEESDRKRHISERPARKP
jgi:hypothetical protein